MEPKLEREPAVVPVELDVELLGLCSTNRKEFQLVFLGVNAICDRFPLDGWPATGIECF